MTQNLEQTENNFHGKTVMYGGFALLDHSLLVLRLSCVVHGPIYDRFMGFYVNGFLSI